MNTKKIWSIGVLAMLVMVVVAIIIGALDLFSSDENTYDANPKREQQIEQAIAAREYDKAREIAVKMVGDAYRKRSIDKVNFAQLSYVLDNSSLEDAEYLAKELNAIPILWKVIERNTYKLYERDFRTLYTMLSRYPMKAVYHSSLVDFSNAAMAKANAWSREDYDIHSNDASYYASNVAYNDEVMLFNRIVLQIIDLAIYDGKKEYIKKMMPMLKPEAVEIGRKATGEYAYTYSYKLENKAKADALRKIKEAGINL